MTFHSIKSLSCLHRRDVNSETRYPQIPEAAEEDMNSIYGAAWWWPCDEAGASHFPHAGSAMPPLPWGSFFQEIGWKFKLLLPIENGAFL